jgi:hypothetical protein
MKLYYTEDSLHGKPHESEILNNEKFDLLLNETQKEIIDLTANLKLGRKIKNIFLPVFKNACIVREGIWWADLFIPNSIIFYDNENIAGFKGTFYFIAQVGDKIELRKFSSQKPVKYSDVAYMHSRLDEKKLVKKLERSFDRLLEIKSIDTK